MAKILTPINIFSYCFVALAIFLLVKLYDLALLLLLAYLIAYLLKPLIERLQGVVGNFLALAIVFCGFWGAVIAAAIAISPIIYAQVQMLVHNIPQYSLYIEEHVIGAIQQKINNFDAAISQQIISNLQQLARQNIGLSLVMLKNLWQCTITTLHILAFIALLPIFNFYLLRDGSILTAAATKLQHVLAPKLLQLIQESMQTIIKFFKGLINVCLIMACYYSICFAFIGIDFSLLLGLLSGFAVAVPFVGILIATLAVIFITVFHFGLDWHLTYVGLISLCGQMLENYIITPKIVGEKIGLNPLLMIISLLVWGKLFGIVGLFLAIPMTCVLNVILKNIFEAR